MKKEEEKIEEYKHLNLTEQLLFLKESFCLKKSFRKRPGISYNLYILLISIVILSSLLI